MLSFPTFGAAPRISTCPEINDKQAAAQKHAVMESNGLLRCKIVVVGDAQCGKTALLHVFAKDSYPEVGHRFSVNAPGVTGAKHLEPSVPNVPVYPKYILFPV